MKNTELADVIREECRDLPALKEVKIDGDSGVVVVTFEDLRADEDPWTMYCMYNPEYRHPVFQNVYPCIELIHVVDRLNTEDTSYIANVMHQSLPWVDHLHFCPGPAFKWNFQEGVLSTYLQVRDFGQQPEVVVKEINFGVRAMMLITYLVSIKQRHIKLVEAVGREAAWPLVEKMMARMNTLLAITEDEEDKID